MKTKFSIPGFVVVLPILLILFFMVVIYPGYVTSFLSFGADPILVFLMPILLLPTAAFVLFGEVRNKLTTVEFNNTDLIVTRFFGLQKHKYPLDTITGWKYRVITTRRVPYRFISLFQNDKKVAVVSDYYHRNFEEVKEYVDGKFEFMGFENFDLKRDFREMFQSNAPEATWK